MERLSYIVWIIKVSSRSLNTADIPVSNTISQFLMFNSIKQMHARTITSCSLADFSSTVNHKHHCETLFHSTLQWKSMSQRLTKVLLIHLLVQEYGCSYIWLPYEIEIWYKHWGLQTIYRWWDHMPTYKLHFNFHNSSSWQHRLYS